ncbi:MAG: MFS transporter [Spirochaetales bacterium]|nr:MFS transporter [Spirochaetales bacterium]
MVFLIVRFLANGIFFISGSYIHRSMNILTRFNLRPDIRRALAAPIGRSHILLPAAFLVALGLNMLTFGIVFYMADTFSSTPGEIGSLSALWSVCYLAGCFLLRPLGKRLLPRHSMIAATASMAVSLSLVVLLQSRPLTFLLYGIAGLSTSLFFPPLMTWLATGIEGPELNKTMARFSFSWSLGGVISPFIAGHLVEASPAYVFYACISALLMTFLAILLVSIKLRGVKTSGAEAATQEIPEIADHSTPLRFPAWAGNFSVYVLMGTINVVFPLFAREELLLKESMIGIIMLLRALYATLGFLFFGRFVFWHFNRKFLLILQTVLVVFSLLLMFLRSFTGFLLVLPFQGFILSAFYSSSVFHGAVGCPERQQRMAIHEGVLTIGVVLGSVLGGLIYQQTSIRGVFTLVMAVAGAVLLGQGVFFSRTKEP